MNRTTVRVAASATFMLTLAVGLAGCVPPPFRHRPPHRPVVTAEPFDEEETAAPDESTEVESDTSMLLDQGDALDAYVEKLQGQIPDLQAQFADTYSAIEIYGWYPDTVEYDYTFANELDPAVAAQGLEEQLSTYQDLCDTSVFPEMARADITIEPKIVYTYRNSDGTMIWTHTFEPSS